MSSSGSSRRRVTDTDPRNLQYATSQGGYPVTVAQAQQASARDPRDPGRSRYGREYRNSEGPADARRQNFDPNLTIPASRRHGDDRDRYYETPVHAPSSPSRFDHDRRSATLQQVQRAQNVHPNDRGRLATQGINDPGAVRVVGTADPRGGGPVTTAGMMHHPQGNPTGYERAPLEPLDRSGRAERDRYNDYRGGNTGGSSGGGQSWPPRGANSADLRRMEEDYSRRGGGRSGGGSSRR